MHDVHPTKKLAKGNANWKDDGKPKKALMEELGATKSAGLKKRGCHGGTCTDCRDDGDQHGKHLQGYIFHE